MEKLNNELKKRGRPRNILETQSNNFNSEIIENTESDLVVSVEKYLKEAKWTKRELMSAMGFGEIQLYRWARGESVPRRSTINRMAVIISRRIDEMYSDGLDNPFPGSDAIDGILNELLLKAGFSGTVKGASGDECWNKISEQRLWTLGYTQIPGLSEAPVSTNEPLPNGIIIDYAENISKILGLNTRWKYLESSKMLSAVRERKVDAIAPSILSLPSRLFDFRFSVPTNEKLHSLKGLICKNDLQPTNNFIDFPKNNVELLFVEGSFGQVGSNTLGIEYNKKSFPNDDMLIAYMNGNRNSQTNLISVFILDTLTFEYWKTKSDEYSDTQSLYEVNLGINMESQTAFAFHPEEKNLCYAVDEAIKLFKKSATKY